MPRRSRFFRLILLSVLAVAAMAQTDPGAVAQTPGGQTDDRGRLEAEIAANRLSLQELSRKRAPLKWAAAQFNLGVTLETLGERESGTARLEEAVAAYREALQEYTRARR